MPTTTKADLEGELLRTYSKPKRKKKRKGADDHKRAAQKMALKEPY
jgi:hypothetical protein